MSQHLAVLRSAGLVTTRRDGNTILYRLADARVLEAYRLIQDRSARLAGARTPDRTDPAEREKGSSHGGDQARDRRELRGARAQGEQPVVVDFWAAWCGPCKMVAPEMEKLAAKYDGSVDVVKVDVDANPRLSQAFNIMSIPTIAFFKPGAQPQGVVGFRPLEQLEQQFGLTEFAVAAGAARPTPTDRTGRHRADTS